MKRKFGSLLMAAVLTLGMALPAWAAPAKETKELTVTSTPPAAAALTYQVANDTTIHQVNGPIPVTPGEEISLTAEAASEGYQFHAWAQGGKKVEGTGNSLTITYADVDKGAVNAIFDVKLNVEEDDRVTVTLTVNGNPFTPGGYVTPGSKVVAKGVPEEGYKIVDWLLQDQMWDGSQEIAEDGTLTFTMPVQPVTLQMLTAQIGGEVKMITSARKGGTISPLGEHVYGTGEYIPMLIIPDEGYVIDTISESVWDNEPEEVDVFRGYAGAVSWSHRYSGSGTMRYHVTFCFLLMLFGGHWLYFTPTAEINIDINPSIEMSINRFDQVIDINDFNEDGQKLADSLNIKYKNYADAVEQVLNNDTVTALLSNNEVMTITVTGVDGQQSAKILSGVEAFAEERRNTYCFYASSEEVADAHEMGLSCGKYRAFLELQLLDPNITPETVQEMTMREIRDLIDLLSTDSGNNSSSYDNQQNGHHGYGGGHGRGWRNRRTEQQNAGE